MVDLVASLDDTIAAAENSWEMLLHWLDLLRDRDMWGTRKRISLSQLCTVDGSLVPPTGEHAALPHIGTNRIVGGTGNLTGVVTAEDDGVTSGKYLYDERHVIYSKIRPNLRKVALPDSRGLCSADAYPLLPSPGVPRRYLQQLLLSMPFTEAAVSRSGRTKMPKINRAELMSIKVPAHTTEQMFDFASRFDAMADVSSTLGEDLGALRDLRSNLLAALLSGTHEIPESYDAMMRELTPVEV